MSRFSALIATFVILVAACGGATAVDPAATSSTPAASFGSRPSVALAIDGGTATGTWPADPTAPLDLCQHATDGSWRVQYAATGPTIDLFVGPHAAEPGHANELALEVDANDRGYLHVDEAGFRTHDPAGRSHMTVAIQPADGGTTLVVTGTTPYHAGLDDYGLAKVTLTAACPT